MATKTISAWEARRNFGKMMDEVARTNQTVIVESHGEPKVAIVPVSQAEAWERESDEFFRIMDLAASNSGLTEDEAMELANEIIAEYRAERRAPNS